MAHLFAAKRSGRWVWGLLVGVALALSVSAAQAQISGTTPVGAANPYPNFFDVVTPGRFSLTLFGGGFGSDQYGTTQEGVQFEQSLTRYVGIVGRATGYQLFMGHGFANPLLPNPGTNSGSARYNF